MSKVLIDFRQGQQEMFCFNRLFLAPLPGGQTSEVAGWPDIHRVGDSQNIRPRSVCTARSGKSMESRTPRCHLKSYTARGGPATKDLGKVFHGCEECTDFLHIMSDITGLLL